MPFLFRVEHPDLIDPVYHFAPHDDEETAREVALACYRGPGHTLTLIGTYSPEGSAEAADILAWANPLIIEDRRKLGSGDGA
jgi:hypothetical protein